MTLGVWKLVCGWTHWTWILFKHSSAQYWVYEFDSVVSQRWWWILSWSKHCVSDITALLTARKCWDPWVYKHTLRLQIILVALLDIDLILFAFLWLSGMSLFLGKTWYNFPRAPSFFWLVIAEFFLYRVTRSHDFEPFKILKGYLQSG